MENILLLLGQVILGGYFFLMGINHITRSESLIGYADSKGVPSPKLGNYIASALLILGGLGIIAGLYMTVSASLIILFLVAVNFMIHNFWNAKSEDEKSSDMQHFLKNTALIGALLIVIARSIMG
ncbi:MAG: quinol oxidase [Parcubacteria group bacterium CG11_big_fil_rev_8_21_14_0_20_39_22]|nr:MAG: quinol oxidase [Parcubacteria group bacterium CG11_big_fil_rev_8_21_14_0_20_39_22]